MKCTMTVLVVWSKFNKSVTMKKKRRKFIKKQFIEVNGKKVEVSIFGTSIKLNETNTLASIDNLLEEEKIERSIRNILEKIKPVAQKYPIKMRMKNLQYYYEIGRILQFVDKGGYTDMRGLIWERMANDLNPEFFGGRKKIRAEAKRHPEFMYLLGKIPKEYLEQLSWDRWYEVLKFKKIYKDKKLLKQIINDCKKENLSGIPLRNRIKELRKLMGSGIDS